MKLFFFYLKSHVKTIFLTLIFIAVFSAVTLMYGYPVEPVLYASCICIYLELMVCLIGFLRFRRRHILLQKLAQFTPLSADTLPEPRTVLEQDYLVLLRMAIREQSQLETSLAGVRRENEDYYTMWTHQIKTPIAAMRLLLQTKNVDETGELSAQLFKIEEYVEMALGYVRSESLSSDLLVRRLPLDTVIRQAVRKYAAIFIAKKIRLCYDGTDVQVVTDEKWLLFVLEQLLSNALKYTEKGSISIYLKDNVAKTLVVEDTGIGIRAEDIPRVFERGYTGYQGRAFSRSTGIGLYLCRRILHKLGHSITIESEPGRGTRVLVDLQEYDYQADA